MSVELRRADASDWAAIERLLSANALPLDGAREHLAEFLVAVDDGKIIGCVGLEIYEGAGLLRSVAVDATHRGLGIAQKLTAAAVARASATGLSALYLLTTTAAGYFPRYGFVTAAREEAPGSLQRSAEFRGACPATATMQMLQLGAEPVHRAVDS